METKQNACWLPKPGNTTSSLRHSHYPHPYLEQCPTWAANHRQQACKLQCHTTAGQACPPARTTMSTRHSSKDLPLHQVRHSPPLLPDFLPDHLPRKPAMAAHKHSCHRDSIIRPRVSPSLLRVRCLLVSVRSQASRQLCRRDSSKASYGGREDRGSSVCVDSTRNDLFLRLCNVYTILPPLPPSSAAAFRKSRNNTILQSRSCHNTVYVQSTGRSPLLVNPTKYFTPYQSAIRLAFPR
jgi:hypothetical protein